MAELLIASSLFLLCFSMVFVVFNRGREALHSVERTGSLSAALLRLKSHLQADFKMTSLGSVTIEPSSVLLNRDSVSCVILDDWSKPSNFSPTSPGPRWNQRGVYVNGLTKEGDLDRVVFVPDDKDMLKSVVLPAVWPRPAKDVIVSQKRISSHVSRFEVSVDEEKGLLEFKTSLKKDKGRSVSGEFVFEPRNSWDFIK